MPLDESRGQVKRAQHLHRAYPIDVLDKRLRRRPERPEHQPYLFCVALSVGPLFDKARAHLAANSAEQGDLLEELTEVSLKHFYHGWGIHRTGWSKTTPALLPAVARRVAALIDSRIGEPEIFSGGQAKEAGLDVLCFRPFPDGRGGYPCVLVQCTTGASVWKSKRKEPDLEIWKKAVSFDNPPVRAFVIPFAISASEMRESTIIHGGTVLDRVRLLMPGRDGASWLSAALETKLNNWCKKIAKKLPRVN